MREEHMQQPVIQAPCFGTSVTLDIIDHSPTFSALRAVLEQSAATLKSRLTRVGRGVGEQGFFNRETAASRYVEVALQRLLLSHCDFTVTDFRCVRLGLDARRPRAWGCYRLTHTLSGEWVEVVASHLRDGGAPDDGGTSPGLAKAARGEDPQMLMVSMALALHGLLFRLQVADWQSPPIEVEMELDEWDGANIEIDADDVERPTQPGWPPPHAAVA